MRTYLNKKAYTMVELLIAMVFTVVLMVVMFTFYNMARTVGGSGMSTQLLQDGANIVLGRMMQGSREPGGTFRLAQGVSYCIGTGASCGGAASTAELHFWGTDNIERWYTLNNDQTALIYHHPTTAAPTGADEIIYTAPTGSTITLFFWIPAVANNSNMVVGARVTLNQGNLRGAVSTVVHLRNHP